MKNSNILWGVCIASFIFFIASAHALVRIEPATRDISMFSATQFTVNVNISGVSNVYGFQFDVLYNQTTLELVSISEGRFLNNSGADRTFCLNPITSTAGLIDDFACSRIGTGSANGSRALANITFRLRDVPTPSYGFINLTRVKVSDINSLPLDSTSQNGTVRIYPCLSGETKTCTINSCAGSQTCNVSNMWGACSASSPQTEVCDGVDNDCDGSIDESLTRACSVNHVGICATGTETCTVGAWTGCPSAQTEVCDNTIDESCDGTDPLCAGDVSNSAGNGTSDRCVNIFDLTFIVVNFGLSTGQPGFNARADINVDGTVDIFDLVIVGRDYGRGSLCP